ncbi:MAG: 7-cyano-7-deazaguanine synthase QueC [Candidatus Tectomicrobia bacterium]|uniref:7-cyano-7-deazaguanine synthase n=1 Tax=Tectimicrobiota bacterium TaxID=2528274 RepID=A0A937VZ36_UNCTE|nr:7-cyano-7-deazaguanine synthase QueC [Candidatus Tectomicrobia bacterium]
MEGAVCLTSGGQDSTTCLFWARQRFHPLLALAFDYGQRHRRELDAAQTVCDLADVPLTVLPLMVLRDLGGSALIGNQDPILASSSRGGLPNTFVPGRNLLFLTVAAAFAYQRALHHLVIGACETDYSGYPDCRAQTMQALETTLQLGMDYDIHIHTPLMYLTKAQTVTLAQDVGAMEALRYSHTCYEGHFPPCGTCPACQLRARGFAEAGVVDPLLQRAASHGPHEG